MQSRVQEKLADDEQIDFRHFLGVLHDSRWMIAGCMLACLSLSLLYVLVAKPQYQADAMVQVEPKSSDLSSTLSSLTAVLDSSGSLAVTEIDILESQRVVGAAVDQMNLVVSTGPGGNIFSQLYAQLFRGFSPDDITVDSVTMSPEVESSLDEGMWLKAWLLGGVKALRLDLQVGPGGTYTLFRDGSVLGKGKVGEEFVAENGGIHLRISHLKDKPGQHYKIVVNPRLFAIDQVLKNLDAEEDGKDSGIIQLTLTGDDSDVTQGTLESIIKAYVKQNVLFRAEEAQLGADFLRKQLPKVKSDLYHSEDILNAYREKYGVLDVSLETQAVLQQATALETQLNDIKLREAEISHEYAPGHPIYKSLQGEHDAVVREQSALKAQILKMPQSQQTMLRLMRDVDVNQQLYVQMLNQLQALDVQRAGTVGNVRIVDDASVELLPIKPKKLLVLGLGLFAGLTLGCIVAFIRNQLNSGVESVEELENAGISVMAVVPLSQAQTNAERNRRRTKMQGELSRIGLLTLERPDDTAVEALRSLRTSLHFGLQNANNNIVMISGPAPKVGKTFVSGNLAAVLAQSGQKVLLIDADMRRGTMHEVFGFARFPGLSEVLQGKAGYEEVLHNGGIPNLDVIVRGASPKNPSELILRPKLVELLNWASANYDVVIVDTPPVLAVTDAAIVGGMAGISFLVVRHLVNSLREIELTVRRFEQNGVTISGVVLNGLDLTGGGYRYGYSYYTYDYRSGAE